MSILIKLERSNNKTKSSFGKWYAKTVSVREIHTPEIAEIICRNTTYKEGEIKGLIAELVDEMKHQMQEGKTVVLDGFGRFRLVAESEGVSDPDSFSIKRHIRRVVCKFLPSGVRDMSGKILRNFADGVSVEMVP